MPRPVLAPAGDDPNRRSLVLAGGGMRVAYQAGALAALDQHGLTFAHMDGASGGTMNLSMLLTGQSIDEMCERWRGLDPRGFSSLLPAGDYLRSPRWPALGGSKGVRDKVFPALGIVADEIRRSEGVQGTYNVCNFATKTAEVIDHPDVDEDLLVAAISLPVLMPAVRWRGAQYTDAVWIRDSNVPEAARRGSDEVWLIWCIGNTPQYFNGSFRQYVHMIEMAANGSLLGDLDRLAGDPAGSALRLHVIKPSRPLPLDPDYFLGRIDAASLIGLGYRDACAYLEAPRPLSAPWGSDVTTMRPVEPGVAGQLRLGGEFAWTGRGGAGGGGASVRLRLQSDSTGGTLMAMDAVGDVTLPGWRVRSLVESGEVTFGGPDRVSLRLVVATPDGRYSLAGRAVGGGLSLTVTEAEGGPDGEPAVIGSGRLGFGAEEAVRFAAGLRPVGSSSALSGWRARAEAARVVWNTTREG